MKNTITDLCNYLMEQIERVNDDSLKGDALDEQIKKSKTIATLSGTFISAADLSLKAAKLQAEYGKDTAVPAVLEMK